MEDYPNKTKMSYLGKVSIKMKIGDKLVSLQAHNTGTTYLKKSFCRFLTGNYRGELDIPEYLDVAYYDENNEYKSVLATPIVFSGKTFEYSAADNNWIAKFTATITHSAMVEEVSSESTYSYRLYMVTGSDEDNEAQLLAYLPVDAEDLSRISGGTQAIVEWTMQLLDVSD